MGRQQVMYQLKNIARLMTLMRITRKRRRRPRQQMMFQLKKTMMRMGRIKTKWVIRKLPFPSRIKRMMIWRKSRRKQPSPQLQLNERTHHHRIETLAGEGDHGDKIKHAHAEKIYDI